MKICCLNLGCKVNQYESDSIALALEKKGHEVFSSLKKADVYIINTCAVTNEAEKKSRQMVSKCRSLNQNSKIVICGCSAEHDPKVFSEMENVTYVTGTKNKLSVIDNLEKRKTNVQKQDEIYDNCYAAKPSRTRAYLKIQDGCNNFCSYCLIPYLRGRSRSRNIVEIFNEAKELSESANEIVLTGINLTDFRIDGKPALCDVLNGLSGLSSRLRLGSLEEGLVDSEFLDTIKKIKNLCPHFHFSLQSGSESVLKRMNRHYSPDEFYRSIQKIRKVINKPAITTDVIVGFPGETEKEFLETVEFVKKVGFSNIHIFPYSKREGTVAASLPQVDGKTKKLRVETLEKVNEELHKKFFKSTKKSGHVLLVEEKIGDYYIGHTEDYQKCYVKFKGDLKVNSFVHVRLQAQYLDGVKGKIKHVKEII